MLTRLEVDGFKNLLGFGADFGPYTCVAGPNAAGKSNIFDAIEFLSLLADHPFMEAAALVRAISGRPSDPSTLFWGAGAAHNQRMTLAAEMIVPRAVVDDFGRTANPTASYLRYEIELEYRASEGREISQMGQIGLVRESLTYIRAGDAAAKLPWRHSKQNFRDAVIFNKRQGTAYISTTDENGVGIVNVHQDGGSRGQPRKSPAARAPRSVVSTTTTTDDPTVLAARREMQQWRMLSLEPSAMRQPDEITSPTSVTANGAHLASTLYRMNIVQGSDAYSAVAAAASALTDVRAVQVDYDKTRDLLTLQAKVGTGPLLPARNLSDGTLRFVALCIMAQDSEFGGVICMEEPENGIHPARIEAMVELVKTLAVDPMEAPGRENPFRQVIVNTHSPAFVQYQSKDELVLAVESAVLYEGNEATTVRLLPMRSSWRANSHSVALTSADVEDYLQRTPGGQLQLDLQIS